MSIQIGTVKSIGKATNYSFDYDDRQNLVKTVQGAVAIDAWDGSRVSAGVVVSCSANFTKADANTIKGWWASRTKKNITLDNGDTISNARILVRGQEMIEGFESSYIKLKLEFWKV